MHLAIKMNESSGTHQGQPEYWWEHERSMICECECECYIATMYQPSFLFFMSFDMSKITYLNSMY